MNVEARIYHDTAKEFNMTYTMEMLHNTKKFIQVFYSLNYYLEIIFNQNLETSILRDIKIIMLLIIMN